LAGQDSTAPPASAFDSLGEAYADAKDAKRALAAYERSYELNPANENAKQMIKKIKGMQ
jgi:cytochrome c-type biogenesis protein CcmH/NrfG